MWSILWVFHWFWALAKMYCNRLWWCWWVVLGCCGSWTMVVGRLIDSLLFRERERVGLMKKEKIKLKYWNTKWIVLVCVRVCMYIHGYSSNHIVLHNFAWFEMGESWTWLVKIWSLFYYTNTNANALSISIWSSKKILILHSNKLLYIF